MVSFFKKYWTKICGNNIPRPFCCTTPLQNVLTCRFYVILHVLEASGERLGGNFKPCSPLYVADVFGPSQTFQPTSGDLLAAPHTPSPNSSPTLLRELTGLKMRRLVILAALACFAAAQHQALVDYLEQRLLAIEVRLASSGIRDRKGKKLLKESAWALECRCGEMLEKFN